MRFHVKDGLRLMMNPHLRPQLDPARHEHLVKKMKLLEERQALEWERSVEDEMIEELDSLQIEIDSLDEMDQLDRQHLMRELEALEAAMEIEAKDGIISINIDPHAAIFNISDYCVVEDLSSFIPLLLHEHRKMREGETK